MQGRLVMAKVLWEFDLTEVPAQNVDVERTMLHYGALIKSEVKIRFVPVNRDR